MAMNLYQQPEKHLVQFNAGKCTRDGNLLKPDLRKGMIYMDQGDDQLMHFYWKERKHNSQPEDDLIIFPDEAELVRVPECTTGRVILLKFKTSSQRLFYWMQKLDDDMDEQMIQRVNQLINDPSSAMDDSQMDIDSSDHSIEMELMQRLMGSAGQGNLTEENLLELFQQAGQLSSTANSGPNDDDDHTEMDNNTTNATVPSTTDTITSTAATTTTSDTTEPSSQNEQPVQSQQESEPAISNDSTAQFEQLQSLMESMQQSQGSTSIQLGDVLTNQTLSTLLSDSQVCSSLFPFLPENSERTPEEVQQVARSPQFQQALQSLTAALQSGQLGPLLTQLGLDPSAGNGVEAFLKAIEDQARTKENSMDED
ncbi:proteasome complex subunit Rpn13 ubiquitin receptor-domain-containing protein [Halteromyces radiatus]|uniref:proteasome complex subunit Rpn13 ubiquitin receptor-domain-containing protein n=1 Tax=Halteromyces radiatus TaxID=101107 RepID=UPI00221EE634|nr:proteasome complex subunit Rpn13 ubiquitin receptor-domain-containing protein [Halteromyces radiatus]KAI8088855.1 proteasome complex subunit Rpn13 ubiquitin receptor-domain-containing protein [Halteromyces radiatus]